jgi:prepilin-type N-terminal cleavage/methylation domain-containing protein
MPDAMIVVGVGDRAKIEPGLKDLNLGDVKVLKQPRHHRFRPNRGAFLGGPWRHFCLAISIEKDFSLRVLDLLPLGNWAALPSRSNPRNMCLLREPQIWCVPCSSCRRARAIRDLNSPRTKDSQAFVSLSDLARSGTKLFPGDSMKKQTGFSLIELLIVVAIILIIAAIAIPNLMRSRMAANESSAVGSIRSINTA